MFLQKRSDYETILELLVDEVDRLISLPRPLYFGALKHSRVSIIKDYYNFNEYYHTETYKYDLAETFQIYSGPFVFFSKNSYSWSSGSYDMEKDVIHLADIVSYKNPDYAYNVYLHELIHWTMRTERCDREIWHYANITENDFVHRHKDYFFSDKHSSDLYHREELIAQLGAMLLSHDLDLDFEPCLYFSAVYLAFHLRHLRRSANLLEYYFEETLEAVEFLHKTVRDNFSMRNENV